jgi:DinB superfamily
MIQRPEPSEHPPYYSRYIELVKGNDLTTTLGKQIDTTLPFLRSISDQKSLHRYATAKWSIKEVIGHLIDAERIFAYRALRFARNDPKPAAGFDQDPYVDAAESDARRWSDLISEFEHVRRANILFFRGLTPEAAMRSGTANDAPVTVRALGYIIAGHELHHVGILRERYF